MTHLGGELSKDAVDIIVVRQRIKEVSQRLSTNDYEGELIPRNEEFNPVYNEEGKRILNTNEKTKVRLQLEKQALEKEGLPSNSLFQIQNPLEIKIPQKKIYKLYLPDNPDNRTSIPGLIIGPHGYTLKDLDDTFGVKITVRGHGPSRQPRPSMKPLPGDDEPLHAHIQGDSDEQVNNARQFLETLVHNSAVQEQFRKQQLRKLAELRGTLMNEPVVVACHYCGKTLHKAEYCPLRYINKKELQLLIDEENGNRPPKVENKDDDLAAFMNAIQIDITNANVQNAVNSLVAESTQQTLFPFALPTYRNPHGYYGLGGGLGGVGGGGVEVTPVYQSTSLSTIGMHEGRDAVGVQEVRMERMDKEDVDVEMWKERTMELYVGDQEDLKDGFCVL